MNHDIAINKSQNASVDNKINMELNHIYDWLKCNKLSLNIGKSKYIIFHNLKRKLIICTLKLKYIRVLSKVNMIEQK